MNLKIGIVGLANVGKSTLFNALLKRQVALAANYPFATIEPNIGVVPVPDQRLATLAQITKDEEKLASLPPLVPAVVEFVDIAGLVKGASEGQGLGNKFLSHIREVNIICQVLRYFEDPDIIHVDGTPDAQRDRQTVETELILADLQTLAKTNGAQDECNKGRKGAVEVIVRLKTEMDNGKLARVMLTDPDDAVLIRDLQLLTMKPILYVGNVSESQMADSETHTGMMAGLPDPLPEDLVLISAKIESELMGLPENEQKEYLRSLGLESSGLDRLIQKAYMSLGLISFLTCGEKEVRAWTIEKGIKAPQAAGTIHGDFEKKFIKADTVSYGDFVTLGGWKAAREHGKARFEGKEYVMQDGDVVEFKIGT